MKGAADVLSMKKKAKMNVSRAWIYVEVFSLTALILFVLLLLVKGCESVVTPHVEGPPTETVVEKNPDLIAIPGYEALELAADSKEQTICLKNPPQNVCYFQISLYLADGTLLWKSELIEPGKTSKAILLTQALEKGTYTNAVLKYDCFQMDGKTPLNGAETKLTLWVK